MKLGGYLHPLRPSLLDCSAHRYLQCRALLHGYTDPAHWENQEQLTTPSGKEQGAATAGGGCSASSNAQAVSCTSVSLALGDAWRFASAMNMWTCVLRMKREIPGRSA